MAVRKKTALALAVDRHAAPGRRPGCGLQICLSAAQEKGYDAA